MATPRDTFSTDTRPNETLICLPRNKNRLVAAGLALLCLLSVSLIVTAIVQSVNQGKTNDNDADNTSSSSSTVDNIVEYCVDRGCLSAASHQLKSLDNASYPNRCNDFYTYACNRWQQTHPLQSSGTERTIIGDMISRRDADIERLLNSPITSAGPNSWEWKVKTYYTVCLDDYARVLESGQALVSMIKRPEAIGGWYLFDNGVPGASQDFLIKNQTILEQISQIHANFGATVAFGLRTRFDDRNSTIKRLEFYPSGLTMQVNDYLLNNTVSNIRRSAYQTYIAEILILLTQEANITDENMIDRIQTVLDDVLYIEKALAVSRQNSQNNGDRTVLISLQDMTNQYSFDFVELLAFELGDGSLVSGSTMVYVTNPTYFQEAFALFLRNNDPTYARRIHNYMRWRFIHTYIDDLSYNYVHSYRDFLNKYYGHALHSSNEDYCTSEVIRRFPLAIHRLYSMNLNMHPNMSETVQSLFNMLKNGLLKYIDQQATWMTDDTKAIAKQKLNALTAVIGYASIASHDSRLDDYYERFTVREQSHIENAYNYYQFHAWTITNSLFNPNQLDHWDYFETRTNRLYEYIAIFNKLFVITTAMNAPLINTEWPWAVNLGSLGVLLAEQLFSSIDGPEGRVYSATGTRIPDWWSAATASAYNVSRKCIADYYVNEVKALSYQLNGMTVMVNINGEPFSPTTLRHIGALRSAYQALKDLNEMKSYKLPGTELNNVQTFFLAYAQTQCYQREDQLQYIRTQLGIYDERTALNAALMHMPEFAQTFQCPPRENKCF